MKDFVLSRAFGPLLHVADELGLEEAPLVEGLSFTHDELRRSWYARIPWSEYVTYCARFEELAGSEVIDEMGHYLSGIPSFQIFWRIAGRLASPGWYYRLSKHWFGPTMFPAVDLEKYEKIGPRALRVVLRVPDHLPDCPQFFRISADFDRQGPRILGMSPATVHLKLEPRRGTYTIVYPPSPGLLPRLKRAVSAALSSDTLMEEYVNQHQTMLQSFEAAQRSESSFRHLLDGSPQAMMVFNQSQIRYVNQAMADLLGIDAPQLLVGRPPNDVCSDPMSLIEQARNPDDDGTPRQCMFFGDGNRQFPGEVNTISVHFNGEGVYVSIVRDVSTRNETLTRAMELDRIISMGMLAAGVSHEINNPLSFIHTNLQFLHDLFEEGEFDEGDVEEARKALGSSLQGMEKIQRIVYDLNSFARAPESKLGHVDVNTALQPALRWIEPELRRRATLRCSLDDDVSAWSDADRLNQIVLNLLLNAAHAIEPGHPDDNSVQVSTFTRNGHTVVEVRDTGCGVTEEIRHKIFDPFFTTKPAGQGTGLGLFLTKKIADQLHAELELDSEPDRGTTVRLTLPAKANGVAKQK